MSVGAMAHIRLRRALIVVAVAALIPVLTHVVGNAATGNVGYQGPSYAGVAVAHPEAATSDKPESKLWYAGSTWWADMWSTASSQFHIWRYDRANTQWVDTGVALDPRNTSDADTLWDGQHLFVASHVRAADSASNVTGQPAYLYRYTLSNGSWTADAGYPAQINNVSSESMTIDKDSAGRLWATWTQASKLMLAVSSSPVDGTAKVTWSAPFTPKVTGAANLKPDDISAIVAYGGHKMLVMWSNQNDAAMYYATRNDNTKSTTSWQGGTAVKRPYVADDHINLKSLQSDTTGRVWAAVKTSLGDPTNANGSDPLLNLMLFKPGTGSWTSYPFSTVADNMTRPIVMLDEQNQMVHMFATGPTPDSYYNGAGTIYEKTTSMASPSFAPGFGTPVIQQAGSAYMNNVTGSKQPVNDSTGLVVLASNESTQYYWWSDESLPGPAPSPSPSPSPTASGGSTLTFPVTDDATIASGQPSSNFGSDTRLSADQSPLTDFLLRFDPEAPGCTLVSATLQITDGTSTYDDSPSGGNFYTTATNWSESTVTWNTAPASAQFAGSIGTVALGQTYTLDVTPYVTVNQPVAFRVAKADTEGVKYFSKEGSVQFEPQLLVTCAGTTVSPTPTPTDSPTPTPTDSPTPTPTDSPTPTPTPTSQSLSFAVTDDATIVQGSGDTNYGSTSRLGADQSPMTNFLVRFNPQTSACTTVLSAQLQITDGTSTYDDSPTGGNFYVTSANWSESQVTWNNAPAAGSLVGSLGAVALGKTYTLDVTPYVTLNQPVAFRVAKADTEGVKYFSKEGSVQYEPRLLLTCS